MSRKKMILKLLTVIVGTVIAAFGLDIAIYAGFGSATLAVLWQGMAKTIRITIGQASLIIASAMVVFCWFYDATFDLTKAANSSLQQVNNTLFSSSVSRTAFLIPIKVFPVPAPPTICTCL